MEIKNIAAQAVTTYFKSDDDFYVNASSYMGRFLSSVVRGWMQGPVKFFGPMDPSNHDDLSKIMNLFGRSLYGLSLEEFAQRVQEVVDLSEYNCHWSVEHHEINEIVSAFNNEHKFGAGNLNHLNPAEFKPNWSDHWWYRVTSGSERAQYRRELAFMLIQKAIEEGDSSCKLFGLTWERDHGVVLLMDYDFVVVNKDGDNVYVDIVDTADKFEKEKNNKVPGRVVVLIREKDREEIILRDMLEQIR